MSWYKKGAGEIKKTFEENEKITKLLKEKTVPWFRIKTGEEGSVILLDDDFFYCEIHTVRVAGRWRNLTCCAGIRPCPICLQEGKRPTPTMFCTVLDLRPYKRDDGTIEKYRKVLLGARGTLSQQLLEYKENYGSLAGVKLHLKRYSDKESACGIVKTIDMGKDGKPKKYNLTSLPKDLRTPFNYEIVLAPFSNEELERIGYSVNAIVGDTPLDEIIEDIEEEKVEEMEDVITVEDDTLEDEELPFDTEEEEEEDDEEELDAVDLDLTDDSEFYPQTK